jgi:hydrogenase-4 component B
MDMMVDGGLLPAAFISLCGLGVFICLFAVEDRIPLLLAWTGSLASLVAIWLGADAFLGGATFHLPLWTLPEVGALGLGIDRLSGLFVLISGLVSLAASLFSAAYLRRYLGRYSLKSFGISYHILIASIVLVLLADEVLTFLIAWELMAISSYLLVNFEHEHEEATQAAFLMLSMGEAGLMMVLLAFLLMGVSAESLSFAALKTTSAHLGNLMRWSIFLLSFSGFAVKAGLIPLNSWLPRAHPAAPANVSALLSGAILNLGLYGILRVNVDLMFMPSIASGILIMVIGAITALVGILYASTADDLKTVLAHSSIENIGIITTAFGAGFIFIGCRASAAAAIAFAAAFYQMLNHSVYKTLLFLGAGGIDAQVGTRSLDRLGGLIRSMPCTAAAFLVGALSIAAIPPLNGFVSEWLTLQTLLLSAALPWTAIKIVFAVCGAILALTAALAVTCFVKVFGMGFLGMSRSKEAASAVEAPIAITVPLAALALTCIVLGVTPTYVIPTLDRVIVPLVGASASDALIPAFFTGSPAHSELPAQFVADFHNLGAQVGQHELPGRGLVVLHRGGIANPVVFAMSTSYMAVVLILMLLGAYVVFRLIVARSRTVQRRTVWDGGIRQLLPEMTYTATGFSNPVRVVFEATFKPSLAEDTRDTVGTHFREAIRRTRQEDHVIDRFVLNRVTKRARGIADQLARIHHGQLNLYVAYGLFALIGVLLFAALTTFIHLPAF